MGFVESEGWWVRVLALPLSSSGSLGESFNYAEPPSYTHTVDY